MEEILVRFPLLGQKIFKQLDDKNLVKIRQVSKILCIFLDNNSLLWRRRIQNFAKNQAEFTKDWKLVTENVSTEFLNKL